MLTPSSGTAPVTAVCSTVAKSLPLAPLSRMFIAMTMVLRGKGERQKRAEKRKAAKQKAKRKGKKERRSFPLGRKKRGNRSEKTKTRVAAVILLGSRKRVKKSRGKRVSGRKTKTQKK